MRMAAILPHTLLYGGVKRYLELGNRFVQQGHPFTIYTPDGKGPDWFDFKGTVAPLAQLAGTPLEVLITSEEEFLPDMLSSSALIKAFYVISKNKALKEIARHKHILFLANSTTTFKRIRRYTGITPLAAFGGVSLKDFAARQAPDSDAPICVLTYGRLNFKFKGTELVVKACERLYRKGYDLKLLLYDTPLTDTSKKLIEDFRCNVPFEFISNLPPARNVELFNRAHIFAIAERKGGWSNTAAEAMAAGTAVIATKVGTEDFLRHKKTGLVVARNSWSLARAIGKLARDSKLRKELAAKGLEEIRNFDWSALAQMLSGYFQDQMAKSANTVAADG
jgi:glycosyltransferase involved in cell wall biosynthesis